MLTFKKKGTVKGAEDTGDSFLKNWKCLNDPKFCTALEDALAESVPDKDDAHITCSEDGVTCIWDVATIPVDKDDISYIEKGVSGHFMAVFDILDNVCIIKLRRVFVATDCASIILDVIGDLEGPTMESIVPAVAKALYEDIKYEETKTALLKLLGDLGYVDGETGSEGDTEPSSGEEK